MGLWGSKEAKLHEAVRVGDRETVTQLLDAGVAVNSSSGERTLLYTAILHRRYDLAKYLIQRGAKVTSGYYTDTPLHLASRMGAGQLVNYLLRRGASVNVTDHNNCTPLWEAVAENKMAAVQVLLQHPGIDLNQPCNERFMKDGGCNAPLMQAVEANNLELVSLLCQHGADLEQADRKGHKPLHRASYLGFSEVVGVLISKGSDIDAVAENNVTPLYLACERGHGQIATMLINAGCDVTISRNTTGWKHKLFSPLHVAAMNGHTEIVRHLCDVGVPVDLTEYLGKTPLILASDSGYFEILEILIGAEADVNHRDVFGHTPLFYSLRSSQRWLQRKLERSNRRSEVKSCDRKCVVPQTQDTFSAKAVELLLDSGAEMNFRDNSANCTPLIYSIMYGHADTTCILLQHGAEINVEDLQVENMRWENTSIAQILVHYSQDFQNFAARACTAVIGEDLCENQEPLSLSNLCRLRIRQTLQKRTRRSIKPLVDKLPLPLPLKNFILFYEMSHIIENHCEVNH